MLIRFGYRNIEYPGPDMGKLRESQDLLTDNDALVNRMREDGYLLLRGLIDRENVLAARRTILAHMDQKRALAPDTPLLEGVMPRGGKNVQMMGQKGIAHHPDVLSVLESETLFNFFRGYFGEPALTFHYKWLRGVGNEEYTGAHYDIVYMGLGSANLHTVWIPFGDIPVGQGTLAMCVGSHNSPGFARLRQTYGRMDVDRDKLEGWFTKDPMEIVEKFGGAWRTTNYRAGDVIMFGMYTMHASTTNLTNRFRLSSDVRYQPAGDPVDKRWIQGGSGPTNKGPVRRMEEVRQEWKV